MLQGGHAENALPQLARATVNCRMLPGSDPKEVQGRLEKALADPRIKVSPIGQASPSTPSPLRPDLMEPLERITKEMWNVPVVPVMLTGATDGLYLRNAGIPTYGVSGIFEDIDDVRAHGRDERIGIRQFHEATEFLYRPVKAIGDRPLWSGYCHRVVVREAPPAGAPITCSDTSGRCQTL
jgi:acetylornithine deacetylase/succinyl-diaminopimelate desuccinylase-like protein